MKPSFLDFTVIKYSYHVALRFSLSLLNLQVVDINLTRGNLTANPKTRNRQSRVIKLEPHQILPFNHYVQNIYDPCKKNLFAEKERTLVNHLQFITKQLKTQLKHENIDLKSLNQLRQSRYAIWYKQHGIRKAQYLGGFKSPYTIQKYANLDIEDLKSAVEKFHPLQ